MINFQVCKFLKLIVLSQQILGQERAEGTGALHPDQNKTQKAHGEYV